MTQTFAPNANNDIYIDSTGNLAIDTGQQAVLDACQTATLMQLGEAIFQQNLGMPTFQVIWNGVPNKALYDNALRQTIQSVEGVVAVTALTSQISQGVYSYQVTIETLYGTTYLQG